MVPSLAPSTPGGTIAGSDPRSQVGAARLPGYKKVPMHKFGLGELVEFRLNKRPWERGLFVVKKLLPGAAAVPEYRIKSTGEPFERSATEGELQEAV